LSGRSSYHRNASSARLEDETIVRRQPADLIDPRRGETQVLDRYGLAMKPDR
jgi:hypothetical protein